MIGLGLSLLGQEGVWKAVAKAATYSVPRCPDAKRA